MARDGFVRWEGSRYGVHWKWVGRIVQVGQRLGTVEIWAGDELIAVHPQGQRAGQHFILPGQWAGLPSITTTDLADDACGFAWEGGEAILM